MADEGARDAQPEALASDDGSWELPESESDVPDADPVERVEPSFRNEAATHNDGHGHAGFTSTANENAQSTCEAHQEGEAQAHSQPRPHHHSAFPWLSQWNTDKC